MSFKLKQQKLSNQNIWLDTQGKVDGSSHQFRLVTQLRGYRGSPTNKTPVLDVLDGGGIKLHWNAPQKQSSVEPMCKYHCVSFASVKGEGSGFSFWS